MQTYRSLLTIKAVQYQGEPIPDVTCDGDRDKHGCDGARAHLPHVHTMATGGLSVLREGFWIVPEQGGPFAVYEDLMFRSHYEVPEEVAAPVEVVAPVEEATPIVEKKKATPKKVDVVPAPDAPVVADAPAPAPADAPTE